MRLPSDTWAWDGDWSIDMSGAVAPNAPGTLGGGWESCQMKPRGTVGLCRTRKHPFGGVNAFSCSTPGARVLYKNIPFRGSPVGRPLKLADNWLAGYDA